MKPFPEAILSGLAATVFLLLTTNVALGQLPPSNKAISQKFMKEVAAHVAASDTILKRNDLKATRDHSVWINGLNEQADKLFGDTVFAKPLGYCFGAVSTAHYLWSAKREYALKPEKQKYDSIERATKEYLAHSKSCNEQISSTN